MSFPDFFYKNEDIEISYIDNTKFIQFKYNNRILLQKVIKNTDLLMLLVSPGDFEMSETVMMIYNLENKKFKNELACFLILNLSRQILENIISQGSPTIIYSVIQSFFITLCSKIQNVNQKNIHKFIEKSFDILELKIKNINCLSNRSTIENYCNRCKRYKEIFRNSFIKSGILPDQEITELSKISDIQFKIYQLIFIIRFQHKFIYLPYIMIFNRVIYIKHPNKNLITLNF